MPEHSRPPWRFTRYSKWEKAPHIWSADNELVARVEHPDDAELIALLPEMLGALQKAEAGLCSAGADRSIPQTHFVHVPPAVQALAAIRAVLAKATAQPQPATT
jgi:hypothetical protein